MPPRPPLPNCARINLEYVATPEIGGHVANNIFYVLAASLSSASAAQLATLAGQIQTVWSTNLAPITSTAWRLNNVIATLIDGTETQGAVGTSVAGTDALDPVSPSLAACVSWHISAAYRGGHPRTYMPGFPIGFLASAGSNELNSSDAIAIHDGWVAFLNGVNALSIVGDPVTMGTVSYVRGKVPRITPVFFGYFPSSTRVNTRLAHQRRRDGKLSAGVYESA